MNAGVTEKAVLYSRSRFSWEPSEIGAAKPDGARLLREAPAAFGRLRVETVSHTRGIARTAPAAFGRLRVETCLTVRRYAAIHCQPPSGGCVLKQANFLGKMPENSQPPSGGCVLKPKHRMGGSKLRHQPPSGGCVLKPLALVVFGFTAYPAAFGRLRVETRFKI